jgi:hypothetical protein
MRPFAPFAPLRDTGGKRVNGMRPLASLRESCGRFALPRGLALPFQVREVYGKGAKVFRLEDEIKEILMGELRG